MAYRNIIIQNPAKLSIKSNQLIIVTDEEHHVPVEDISAILLENNRSTITVAALSYLGQCGCAIFVCDEKHLPCAVMMPYQQHSRAFGVLKKQLAIGEVKKKHLWQNIVKSKIENQANCLLYIGNEKGADIIRVLASNVNSGDTGNVESVAAAKYFPLLYGEGFKRSTENNINSALNYGYSIIRGAMARALTVYGFNTAMGIHHRSELNGFNLADDMMEPYRPIIDALVSTLDLTEDGLSSHTKCLLFNALNLDVVVGGQHHSVSYAIELQVKSLVSSLENNENKLVLPVFTEIKQHTYE